MLYTTTMLSCTLALGVAAGAAHARAAYTTVSTSTLRRQIRAFIRAAAPHYQSATFSVSFATRNPVYPAFAVSTRSGVTIRGRADARVGARPRVTSWRYAAARASW